MIPLRKRKENKGEEEAKKLSAASKSQTGDDVLLLDGMYHKWCMENLKYCPSEFDRRETILTELLKVHSFDYLKQRFERFFVTTNKWICNETDRGIEVFKRFVDKHIDEPRVPTENHDFDHLTM